MRRWWKKIGVFAGGLVGMAGLLSPANAQFGGGPPQGPGMFAGDPQQAPPGPDFPNPAPPSTETTSPFSLTNDGSPNAFTPDGPPSNGGYCFTFRGEYLHWWVSKYSIPSPLVTTSLAPNPVSDFGALGQPNTQVLLGAGSQSYNGLNGGRGAIGIATGILPTIEISGIDFNKDQVLFNSTSNGPLLARPVQLVNQPNVLGAPQQSTYVAAFANFNGAFGTGAIGVFSHINFWGGDVDMLVPLADTGTLQLDFLFGYKYLELRESIQIGNTLNSSVGQFFNGNVIPAGVFTSVVDDFAVRNQFNGGTLGFRSCITYSRLSLFTDAKLSLGNTHEAFNLTGTSSVAGGQTVNGGILVGPSNSGLTTHNQFTVVPEVNFKLSCQLTSWARIFAGYDILYWSRVGRPGSAINTAIDPRQVPVDQSFMPGFVGTAPSRIFGSTDFFAQGFSFGLEFGF